MLRKLTIENFYSFKDKQVINFAIPKGISDERNIFCSSQGEPKVKLPKVIALFGANASGKSTLLRAIGFVKWFVINSFNEDPQTNLLVAPFYDSDGLSGVTTISIEFDSNLVDENNPCVYRYSLCLQNNPETLGEKHWQLDPIIKSEKFGYSPKGKYKRLFERDLGEIKDSKEFPIRISDYPLQTFRPNASVFCTLSQYSHKLSTELISRLSTVLSNISTLQKEEFNTETMAKYYVNNPDVLEKLNKKIQLLDLGISNVYIKKTGVDENNIYFKHNGLSTDLSSHFESHGTMQFFALFPIINFVLETGGMAVLDEIDNDIHPMMFPEIVRWFRDPEENPNNAQIIMVCHNASLLEHLEKEEIFFTTKSIDGKSTVYGLKDIKGVRRLDNYYKKYLGGVYGAVPRIG